MSDGSNDSIWYHGSDQELTILRTNSSVTQNRNLARAFSHQPTLLSRSGNSVRHNGTKPGFLYVVDEDLGTNDLIPHPHPSNVGNWEWLITREIRVRLIEKTVPLESECFTDEEVSAIKKKQQELGVQSFASDEPIH